MKFQPGDRVRVDQSVANPFWHWIGEIEEDHVLDGETYYRVRVQGLRLLFHETWLSKIIVVVLLYVGLATHASAQTRFDIDVPNSPNLRMLRYGPDATPASFE